MVAMCLCFRHVSRACRAVVMSAVWNYFTLTEAKSKTAECNVCKMSVSRGGSKTGHFNTTNLIKHLQKHHGKEYGDFLYASAKKSEPRQPSLQETLQKSAKLAPESTKAKMITDKIVEFILLDDQPLCVVENAGFRGLVQYREPRYQLANRHSISDTLIPLKYKQVSEFISKLLESAVMVSLTTDIWSSDVCPVSLISLTAQWIDSSFTLQEAVLQAKKFRDSHTGEAIATATDEILSPCNLLVVNEGLLSQRNVSDALAVGRKIVGHFKHSQLAYSRLQDIQEELNMPPKRLQQDIRTRWYSSYYTIQSLLAEKRALCAYTAEYDLPATLTATQWDLLEKTVQVLAPFEELTREVSSSSPSASDVIPMVQVLKRLLSRPEEADEGIRTIKGTLLEAVRRRFTHVETEPIYSVATLLDPRCKHSVYGFLKTYEVIRRTRAGASEPAEGTSSTSEPAKKTAQVEAASKSKLGNIFDEIMEESTPCPEPATSARVEVQTYFSEPTILRSDNPLLYWKVNQPRLPSLAVTAAEFLCALSTSVESERLFSTASNIIHEKRSRLTAEKAEIDQVRLQGDIPAGGEGRWGGAVGEEVRERGEEGGDSIHQLEPGAGPLVVFSPKEIRVFVDDDDVIVQSSLSSTATVTSSATCQHMFLLLL
uniref:BED-type domain-containing protein n=1 Tax=Amphiprion percula TaxID=161767 RepID=A0A3P8U0R1_AMPPE